MMLYGRSHYWAVLSGTRRSFSRKCRGPRCQNQCILERTQAACLLPPHTSKWLWATQHHLRGSRTHSSEASVAEILGQSALGVCLAGAFQRLTRPPGRGSSQRQQPAMRDLDPAWLTLCFLFFPFSRGVSFLDCVQFKAYKSCSVIYPGDVQSAQIKFKLLRRGNHTLHLVHFRLACCTSAAKWMVMTATQSGRLCARA